VDPQFDDLWPRILRSLSENGAPFDWRDIDGSEDDRFLDCLRQLEKEGLISAAFRISSRLGEQGRIVFAQVTGITDKGIDYLGSNNTTGDNEHDANDDFTAQPSLEALQRLQTAIAGSLVQPGALRLSNASLQGIRQTLLSFANSGGYGTSNTLSHRISAIDDAVLQSLIVKWIAHAVHSGDASSVAALLARLAAATATEKAG